MSPVSPRSSSGSGARRPVCSTPNIAPRTSTRRTRDGAWRWLGLVSRLKPHLIASSDPTDWRLAIPISGGSQGMGRRGPKSRGNPKSPSLAVHVLRFLSVSSTFLAATSPCVNSLPNWSLLSWMYLRAPPTCRRMWIMSRTRTLSCSCSSLR